MENGKTRVASLPVAYSVLAALFAMNLLNYIDRFILAAVVKNIQETPGLEHDDTQAGLLGTIFFVSYAIFSPVVGWLGDRMSRKYLLAIGVGIWSLATFGAGLAITYTQMLLARSVLGVGEAA
ncbi:MAG TPA: MFS transporter, partial [Gemmataceae bacterium]|nr:MFS transporter [Gemmataceae bacterium]